SIGQSLLMGELKKTQADVALLNHALELDELKIANQEKITPALQEKLAKVSAVYDQPSLQLDSLKRQSAILLSQSALSSILAQAEAGVAAPVLLSELQQVLADLSVLGPDAKPVSDQLNLVVMKINKTTLAHPLEISESLSQLKASLTNLQLGYPAAATTLQENQAKVAQQKPEGASIKESLRQSFEHLKSLLVIQHTAGVGGGLLKKASQQASLQSLIFLMDQAKWAAMRSDQTTYDASLMTLKSSVTDLFAPDASRAAALSLLDRLSSLKVSYDAEVIQGLLNAESALSKLS
ncbi:MAG: hypothetical protein EBX40_03390, partial [Gammaproteobacteria bacterium]|nr:hypothetical protein [Gammaproteobacteria bacterium]